MKLKKTDYVVISILIVVVIAGIIGIVLAINLMGENTQKQREARKNAMTNTNNMEEETNIINTVDVNATPEQQMQQLINSMPEVLQGEQKTKISITNIAIEYAYGYDVSYAEEREFIDILTYTCNGEELKVLGELIEKNKFDDSKTVVQRQDGATYNTKIIIDDNTLEFSDKDAIYTKKSTDGPVTTSVVINDELLKKIQEIVNREVAKKVSAISEEGIKSVVIKNSSNLAVTITDAEDIKTICALSSFVPFKEGKVNLSNGKIAYTVEFGNGLQMKGYEGGPIGLVVDNNGEHAVKFMFDVEKSLEAIFKKYSN